MEGPKSRLVDAAQNGKHPLGELVGGEPVIDEAEPARRQRDANPSPIGVCAALPADRLSAGVLAEWRCLAEFFGLGRSRWGCPGRYDSLS